MLFISLLLVIITLFVGTIVGCQIHTILLLCGTVVFAVWAGKAASYDKKHPSHAGMGEAFFIAALGLGLVVAWIVQIVINWQDIVRFFR